MREPSKAKIALKSSLSFRQQLHRDDLLYSEV